MKKLGFLMTVLIVVLSACSPGETQAPAPIKTEGSAQIATEVAAKTQTPLKTEAPAKTGAILMTETSATAETTAKTEAQTGSEVKDLTILWVEWDPARYLQEIGNLYEKETGIKIHIIEEPWDSLYDRLTTEWAARSKNFDMLVGDSQWIGQGVTQGHYVELTDLFKLNSNIQDSVTEASLRSISEYPPHGGKYWAYPAECDPVGWAYRKDLFEDPVEKEAFKAKYGYELAVPSTWDQLRDISEFFTRPDNPKNNVKYGVGIFTQKNRDGLVIGYQNVMFSYGAYWFGDDFKVQGIVNSPEAVQALEFYHELFQFAPPGTGNASSTEMNDAFISGQVAMAMNMFTFFPALANPKINPYADKTGFFSGLAGPKGERYVSLDGQGLSVNAYVDKDRQQAAMNFIKWFATDRVQNEWAKIGGYSCNKYVLASDEFLNNAPYNRALSDSINMVKDFWNIPEYGQLLDIVNRYMQVFVISGTGTAQDVMDNIARDQEQVLKKADYIQ